MEKIQINGQKIWGPPKDWVGPPPPHGTEVFIKNIPDEILEDELFYLFLSVGKIYEFRLPVHWTGKNKGYAFVRFTKISEADSALEKLNQFMIGQERKLKIERSLDNNRLFLSSVPNEKTAEEIKSDLLTVVENVKTVYVYPALENPSIFRGYAFVEFMSHRDAAIAKRILTPDVLLNLFEKKCIAAWANPLPFLNNETLKNINILFMRNIPSNTKSIAIKMAVDRLISPDSVHKVKRLNDYAFLTLKNHEIAERAMMKIKDNPFLLGMKAVDIEWAIPRELVNSLSSKYLHVEKYDGSKPNFEPNVKISHPLSKILDYKSGVIDIYDNVNCFDLNTIENNQFRAQNNANVRQLKRRPSKFESPAILNKTETSLTKIPSKGNFQNYLHQNNLYNSNDLSKFLCDISNRNNTDNQSYISEFYCPPNSEYNWRGQRLQNWLQSLTIKDQCLSYPPSPNLTSPSSCSINLSWK